MTIHCAFDIETLGVDPGCVVLSIGAVTFDEDDIRKEFYVTLNQPEQIGMGFTVNPETRSWWARLPNAAWMRATSNTMPVRDALMALRKFFVQNPADRFWCHKSHFDAPILKAVHNAVKMKTPWEHWQLHDSRTLACITGIHPDRTKGVHHDALQDARVQAEAIIGGLAILKMNGVEWGEA
jgi:hypothetical protein